MEMITDVTQLRFKYVKYILFMKNMSSEKVVVVWEKRCCRYWHESGTVWISE